MSKFNYLDLDGRLLRLFQLVYEERSVTKAADRLNITQSAVSHGLEKLRAIVGDPLFVRSGRGITPTHSADTMIENVRALLRDMRALSEQEGFELANVTGSFVIAANDVLWGLLLKEIHVQSEMQSPNLDLRVIQSGTDTTSLLRNEQCDLVLTPNVPEGSEFKQQKLFADNFISFYDPDVTTAPKNLEDYLSRRHARIVFSTVDTNPIDQLLALEGRSRRVALQVPNFSGLPDLMKGTDLIAVLPSSIKDTIMREFATAPSPVKLDSMNFYQIWHQRDDDRPLHKWMRGQLRKAARSI